MGQFFVASPVPIGSVIEYNINKFTIKTKHSKITIEFKGGIDFTEKCDTDLAKKIFISNGIPIDDETYHLLTFTIISHFELNSFTRFSNQAKYEMDWYKRIEGELAKGFSWDELRNVYSGF